MNILRRILRDRNTSSAVLEPAPRTEAEPSTMLPPIDQEIFIDPEMPTAKPNIGIASPKLRQLASQDRTEEGRVAGYECHDLDICQQMKNRIKAEILCALDDEVERIGKHIDELDVEIRRIRDGGMENALREMEARREQMDRHRMKLCEQQLLVSGNVGYAEFPLASFEAGFKQGYKAYLDATVLIKQYQG